MLSQQAKHLGGTREVLRFAQNDIHYWVCDKAVGFVCSSTPICSKDKEGYL